MLEDSLFASRRSARTKKPVTLALSVIFHGTLAGALILIPLFQNQVLPQITLLEPLQPPMAPPGRPRELAKVSGAPAPASPKIPELSVLIVPPAIPNKILKYQDEPETGPTGFPPHGAGPGGDSNSLVSAIPFGLPSRAGNPPLPPPPPATPPSAPAAAVPDPVPTTPIRRGGDVVQSNLINSVKPEYPRLAIVSRTQGVVILEAVITREGAIDSSRLRILSGHPMLAPAAVEAVKQWRYRPTTLNGQPVEVLTTITVSFTLN